MMLLLWTYAAAALLALCGLGLGRAILRRMRFDSPLEALVFQAGLGLGVTSHLLFLIGLLGGLYRVPVLAGLAAGALAGVRALPAWTGQRRVLLVLGLWLLPVALLPLYPPIDWDATMYHLVYAKHYAASHHVHPLWFVRYPVFPQLNELLATGMMLVAGESAAKMVPLLLLLLLAAALCAWGRRLFDARTGVLAAAFWLGNPDAIKLGTCGYIDIGLACFVTLAVYAAGNYLLRGERAWLLLAAALSGFAASCKYTGLFFVALIGLAVLARDLRQRRITGAVLFALVAGASGAPWYVYNAVHTGNPVFPFAGGLLGYGPWNAADLASQLHEMREEHGAGRTLGAFLMLPINLILRLDLYPVEAPLSRAYLLGLPALLYMAGRDRVVRALALVVLAYVVFWFFGVQIARYLVPVLPALALACTAALLLAADRLPAARRLLRRVPLWVLALVLSLHGWIFAVHELVDQGLPPLDRAGREAYTARALPAYPAFSLLNRTLGRDYRLYGFRMERMAYFADGGFWGDWFGPGRYRDVLDRLADSRRLYQHLRGLGADHFLVQLADLPPGQHLPADEFFRQHFAPVYQREDLRLYQLR